MTVRVLPVSPNDELESPERLAIEAAVEDGFQDFEKGAHSDALELAKALLSRKDLATRTSTKTY